MKIKRIFIFLFSFSIFFGDFLFSQTKNSDTINKINNSDFTIKTNVSFEKKRNNQNVTKDENITNDNLVLIPSIISLVGILISFIVNNSNNITAIRNVTSQIEASYKIHKYEFDSKLNLQNRQAWIDEIRESISVFLSKCALINVKLSVEVKDDLSLLFESIWYLKCKIILNLNHEKTDQKELSDSINEMVSVCMKTKEDFDAELFKKTEKRIQEAARVFFDNQWKKITKLDIG
jgi:hypothetical protein